MPDEWRGFSAKRKFSPLNHPHIAAIYGLEDADGVKGLLMEVVEGEDLAQRLARGAMPLDEALLLDGRFIGTGTQRTYDISRDGQRFLMIKEHGASSENTAPPTSLIVVQNWFSELQQRVPTR